MLGSRQENLILNSDDPAEPPTVLVAEDEPISRKILTHKLARLGVNVIEAEDGAHAVQLARTNEIHLIIIDLDMPVMNGWELIPCLRSLPNSRPAPIVVLTGNLNRAAKEKSLEAGATLFLTKPLIWNVFTSHVTRLLQLPHEAKLHSEKK